MIMGEEERQNEMSDSEKKLKHNPFEKLGKQLKRKTVPTARPARPLRQRPDMVPKAEKDEAAFIEAMRGVKPITGDKHTGGKQKPAPARITPPDACVNDRSVMDHLSSLIETGEGFIVCNTPEYMEGTGPDVPPEFAERLHRGDFSIQAHIDLHGMGVAQASEAFEEFLDRAIMSGKRAVLVIHGRGLSSPGEPVLKNKVREWLTRTSWRKWVIAFTSAQSYDGGAGATYILLRRRPVSKRTKTSGRR